MSQLVAILKSIPELVQTEEFVFTNNDKSLPYFALLLLKAEKYANWSVKDSDGQRTNLIAIVCAKSKPEEFQKPQGVFIKIASCLNGQLIDEETDDGVENYIIGGSKLTRLKYAMIKYKTRVFSIRLF